MEYVDGVTLREKIAAGMMKVEECAGYAIQIGEALQEAHAHGIVHRDIKPENIMINSKNQIKVMDFGLAKLKGSMRLTRTSSTLGTAAYMSPEQARGEEVDERTDIWSFGVVLFQMLTGHLPFRGEHEAAMLYSIVHEDYEPILKLRPDVPAELVNVVEKMLKKDVRERYQHSSDVVRDLRQCLLSTTGAAVPRRLLNKLRRPVVAIPTVVVVLCLCCLGYWRITIEGKKSWARTIAIPEIERLAEEANMTANWAKQRGRISSGEGSREICPERYHSEDSLRPLLPSDEGYNHSARGCSLHPRIHVATKRMGVPRHHAS